MKYKIGQSIYFHNNKSIYQITAYNDKLGIYTLLNMNPQNRYFGKVVLLTEEEIDMDIQEGSRIILEPNDVLKGLLK